MCVLIYASNLRNNMMLTHLSQSILSLLKQRNILKENKCISDLNETPVCEKFHID